MKKSRRKFLLGSAFATATAASLRGQHEHHQHVPKAEPRAQPVERAERHDVRMAHPSDEGLNPPQTVSVETPDTTKMPWTVENGVKVFHITAEPVRREFLPGRIVDCWGFNGSMPGPAIEVTEGDHLRFIVENRLPEGFSMHWHGLEVPIEMDGAVGISQDPIPPGEKFVYEFTVRQNGTFFYHSHMAMQEMMGMIGLFIIHPRKLYEPRVDRDFGLIFQEWAILPNNTIPNTMSMEFNWLTINGRSGPAATPLLVKQGERVRLRLVNLSMTHHPIHIHGNQFYITGTEGGRVPQSAWFPGNTVILGVAQARDVELDAKYLGDWMLHCHLPHHMMNAMASMVGMAHGGGVPAGLGMEEGMGVVRAGHAWSEESGPSLGRGLGVGSTAQERITNRAVTPGSFSEIQTLAPPPHEHPQMQHPETGPRQLVPGFPQDMFMVMDEAVAKPETHGLRPGWTGGMMGMMTMVRVLTPEIYEEIQQLKRNWKPAAKPAEHKHQ